MSEMYTLNRFYFEAKALLEKYNVCIDDYKLETSFEIEEEDKNGLPVIKFTIMYKPKSYSSDAPWIATYAMSTPVKAMSEFEFKLQEYSGKTLIERVCVEVPKEETV